jgi:hypothetical protein
LKREFNGKSTDDSVLSLAITQLTGESCVTSVEEFDAADAATRSVPQEPTDISTKVIMPITSSNKVKVVFAVISPTSFAELVGPAAWKFDNAYTIPGESLKAVDHIERLLSLIRV